MKKTSPLFSQILVAFISTAMIWQPVLAQVVADTNAATSAQADVATTPQGVPMVNIVAPNNSGLSHNQFQEFSVDENNLILNNSQQSVDTIVGGQVNANPNLTNGSATIILNEVTGTERSQLNGYTEIAGDEAELIIANPNGITCDGCGFINTPRAVLSTGTPQVDNGQLMSLSVDQGDILIEGEGVNAGNVDQFDLITRSATINAEVLAQDLTIITGRNDVSHSDLSVTPKTDDNRVKPQVSIDSSLLGGMFANTIRLVGTEAGVGVNLDGEMATNVGDITLSADGNISINSVVAEQTLTLNSHSGDISVDNVAYANQVNLDAANTVNNTGTIAASNDVTVSAVTTNNQADIIAGLNTDSSLNSGATLTIVGESLENNGQLIATDNVRVTTATVNNQNSIIEAVAGDVELDQLENLNNADGNIIAGENIELTIDTLEIGFEQGLQANNNLIVNTASLNNTSDVNISSGLTLNLEEDFNNNAGFSVAGDLNINAENVTNSPQGEVVVNGIADITAQGDVENQGVLTAATGLSINASNITNNNILGSGDALSLTATNNITNASITPDGSPITFNNILTTNTALLFSVGDMRLYSDNFLNRYAELYTLGDLLIAKDADGTANSSVYNSSSLLESAENISIATNAFTNKRDTIGDVFSEFIRSGGLSEEDLSTIAYEDLCNFDTFEYCIAVVGGDDFGFQSGQSYVPWLSQPKFDGDDFIESPQAAANLEQLALAAIRTPEIIAGNDIDIDILAGSFLNEAGVVSAANNLIINANDVVNRSVVAEAAGYGVPVNGLPYIERGRTFHFLDGTLDNSTPSALDFYLQDSSIGSGGFTLLGETERDRITGLPIVVGSVEPPLPASSPIALNINRVGGLDALPTFIFSDGSILVSNGSFRSVGELVIDGDNLFVLDENRNPNLIDSSRLPNADQDGSIFINGSGNYTLRLHGEEYAIVPDENNHLKVQFESNNLPIQFTIEQALSGLTTTAVSSISFDTFDLPVQSPEYTTTFLPAGLQAGNNLTINATNTIDNGASAPLALSASTPPQLEIPTISPVIPTAETNLPTVNNNEATFTEIGNAIPPATEFVAVEVDTTVPTNGGLFTESEDEQFLVATNSAVNGFIDNFGSDFLLQELNYQPETFVRRLGDGFYESYLIRQAILAQTGRRFLHSSIRSDQQQYRYLMENAINAQQALNLTVGIRLNQQQVAALTHDVVWLEYKNINGQKVLVPTLYLATVRTSDIDSSGQVVARSINLNAKRLLNSGTINGLSNVSIDTVADIRNQGAFKANNLLALKSENSIINDGDIISNNSVSIIAGKDITNNSGKTISAKNNAVLNAQRNINLNASTIDIGGSARIDAGNDIHLNASAQTQSSYNRKTITHKTSAINVGGDLALSSGGDTNLQGSRINTDGSALITVGKNLNVNAVENKNTTTSHSGSREASQAEQNVGGRIPAQ